MQNGDWRFSSNRPTNSTMFHAKALKDISKANGIVMRNKRVLKDFTATREPGVKTARTRWEA